MISPNTHGSPEADLNRLLELIEQHNLVCPPDSVLALQTYRDTIAKWNDRVRIVSRQDTSRVLSKHVFESLLLASHIEGNPARLADIGSGGGFPGIPVQATRRDIKVTLVEAARMKCLFLKDAVKAIGLAGSEVVHERAEAFGKENPGLFDVTTSRAVGSLDVVWTLASPMLRDGGVHLALKGPGEAGAELADSGVPFDETVVQVENRSVGIIRITKTP